LHVLATTFTPEARLDFRQIRRISAQHEQSSAVWCLRRARAACLSLIVLTCVLLVPAHADQATLLWNHGSHTQASPDERALRELLARYRAGALEAAVRGVLANDPRWMPTALDAAMRRTDEEITYHRRPENRLGAARDERVLRCLRADRRNVLLLAAALQLEASSAVADVDAVGWHVVGSERTIDRMYALRAEFAQNGPLPWPIAIDEPWESVNRDAREPPRSADWLAVRDFVRPVVRGSGVTPAGPRGTPARAGAGHERAGSPSR